MSRDFGPAHHNPRGGVQDQARPNPASATDRAGMAPMAGTKIRPHPTPVTVIPSPRSVQPSIRDHRSTQNLPASTWAASPCAVDASCGFLTWRP